MNKQVRIGIDVGGTFTDAVVIDNATHEIIAKKKSPTTHDHEEGVARGIITIIRDMLEEHNIKAEDIAFISHGTTQATNALLEGDVAVVGIIGMGDGNSAKTETNVADIELAQNKHLRVFHEFITSKTVDDASITNAIEILKAKGAEVIVASEAFSIEHPEHEQHVIELAQSAGYFATGGYEISQLFGLKLRTRTAVVNGSLIPKMMETSMMTEKVIKDLGIKQDLMIMRADGGVMSVQEVKKRPILTMLSGLAAGIAGAIMHEKISEGVFLEIGGTSTDISVIKDGRVMIKNASVGGHKTYLKSVDVRTTAIAGGTMIRVDKHKKLHVGPRSAHLANLPYECFNCDSSKVSIETVRPMKDDPDDYVIAISEKGTRYALTLAGAANYLELIAEGDYSYAPKAAFAASWEALGEYVGMSGEAVATQCLDLASAQIWNIIEELKQEYELENDYITLYGGGGSAGVLTAYIGNANGVKHDVVDNAPYISTIGVALAMITEQIERSVIDPTEEDIKQIRMDVFDKMLQMGALAETVEVSIEVDSLNHVLIASATGTNEINSKQLKSVQKTDAELLEIAKRSVGDDSSKAEMITFNDHICGIQVETAKKKMFGLLSQKDHHAVMITQDGIVKFRRKGGDVVFGQKHQFDELLDYISDTYSTFSDAGQTIPEMVMFSKFRTFDYSGLMTLEQVRDIASMDLEGIEADERIIFLVTKRG